MGAKGSRGAQNLHAVLIMALRGTALVSKFALTLFIAKYLGIEAVGYYGYLAGAAVILPVALGFGFLRELSRQLVIDGLEAIQGPLLAYWRLIVAAYAGITILAVISSESFGAEIHSRTWILAGIVLLFEHLNNDSFFITSSQKRPLLANFQVFLRAGAWIAVYVPTALTHSTFRTVDWMLIFWASGIVVSFIVFLLSCPSLVRKRTGSSSSVASLVTLARRTRSVYAGEAVGSISVYVDRFLVGAVLGTKAAGIYVVFVSLSLGIYNLVNTGIMQILRPYMIEHHAKRNVQSFNAAYIECMKRAVSTTVLLSILCGTAFHFLLPHLDQVELLGQEPLLWIFLVAVVIRVASDVQGYIFYAKKRDFVLFTTGAVAPLTFICLGALLLPTMGITGGAVASVGAYLMTLLVRSHLLRTSVENQS